MTLSKPSRRAAQNRSSLHCRKAEQVVEVVQQGRRKRLTKTSLEFEEHCESPKDCGDVTRKKYRTGQGRDRLPQRFPYGSIGVLAGRFLHERRSLRQQDSMVGTSFIRIESMSHTYELPRKHILPDRFWRGGVRPTYRVAFPSNTAAVLLAAVEDLNS